MFIIFFALCPLLLGAESLRDKRLSILERETNVLESGFCTKVELETNSGCVQREGWQAIVRRTKDAACWVETGDTLKQLCSEGVQLLTASDFNRLNITCVFGPCTPDTGAAIIRRGIQETIHYITQWQHCQFQGLTQLRKYGFELEDISYSTPLEYGFLTSGLVPAGTCLEKPAVEAYPPTTIISEQQDDSNTPCVIADESIIPTGLAPTPSVEDEQIIAEAPQPEARRAEEPQAAGVEKPCTGLNSELGDTCKLLLVGLCWFDNVPKPGDDARGCEDCFSREDCRDKGNKTAISCKEPPYVLGYVRVILYDPREISTNDCNPTNGREIEVIA